MMNPASSAPAARPRTRPINRPAPASADLRQAIVDPIASVAKRMGEASQGVADAAAYDPIITIPGFVGGAPREMPWSQAQSTLAEEYAKLGMDQKSPEEIAADYEAQAAAAMQTAVNGVARPHNYLADYQEPAPVDPITRDPMPAPSSRRSDPGLLLAAALMGFVAPEAAAPAVQGVLTGTAEQAAQNDANALRRWSADMDAQEKAYNDRLRSRAETIAAGLRQAGAQTEASRDQYGADLKAAELGAVAKTLPLKAAALHTASRTANQAAGIQRFIEATRARVATEEANRRARAEAALKTVEAEADMAEKVSRANIALTSAQHSASMLELEQTKAARAEAQRKIENDLSGRRIRVEEQANRLRQWAQANAGTLTPEQYVGAMRSFTTILSETGDDLRQIEAQFAPYRTVTGDWIDRDRKTGRSAMQTQYNALRDTAVANRNAARGVVAEIGGLVAEFMGVATETKNGRTRVLKPASGGGGAQR